MHWRVLTTFFGHAHAHFDLKKFDLASFNEGNYQKSVEESIKAENITSVLYPNDNTMAGKELRLKQQVFCDECCVCFFHINCSFSLQYFFVCATLKDIVRRFKKKNHRMISWWYICYRLLTLSHSSAWSEFPNHVAIQLNDTHPTLGIVELQRRLVDIEGLPWDQAWAIVTKIFSFTNHTVLPEGIGYVVCTD